MPPFIHDHALCESDAVGAGTRVWAFAHVLAGAVIGRDCNIGGHCFVEDGAVVGDRVTVKNGVSIWRGVTLGDDVFVGPNAVFTNDLRPRAFVKIPADDLLGTLVAVGATIGANATIVAPVRIGRYALVAAGAVVVHDVADHALVAGCPARKIGDVCQCGLTLPPTLECECGRRFHRAENGLVERLQPT